MNINKKRVDFFKLCLDSNGMETSSHSAETAEASAETEPAAGKNHMAVSLRWRIKGAADANYARISHVALLQAHANGTGPLRG